MVLYLPLGGSEINPMWFQNQISLEPHAGTGTTSNAWNHPKSDRKTIYQLCNFYKPAHHMLIQLIESRYQIELGRVAQNVMGKIDFGGNVCRRRDPTRFCNFPCRPTQKRADPDPKKFDPNFGKSYVLSYVSWVCDFLLDAV